VIIRSDLGILNRCDAAYGGVPYKREKKHSLPRGGGVLFNDFIRSIVLPVGAGPESINKETERDAAA
jgi:hypothetical protein